MRGRAPARRVPARARRGRPATTGGLLVAGLAFQVLAWILLIPPFGAYDEFDHAFRASAVAHGQLVAPPSDATRGTGAVVLADSSIVRAAQEQCLSQIYTYRSDCVSTEPGPGLVPIPSGAGRYSPVYYGLVGWVGLTAAGTDALLAQRFVSAALCLALTAFAVHLASAWPATAAVARGVALACTPILLATYALLAPNGLEIAAGLLWAAGLLTLATSEAPARRRVWVALALAGALLGSVRSLGPLWLGTAVLVVLLWRPRQLWTAIVRGGSAAVAAVAVTVAGTLFGVTWTLRQGSLEIGYEPHAPEVDAWGGMLLSVATIPLKIMQIVAAMPGRLTLQPAPILVAWLIALAVLLVAAFQGGERRGRLALLALGVVILVVPVVLEGSTLSKYSYSWQSRYLLPLAVLLPLLAALLVPTRRGARVVRLDALVTAVCVVVASLWAVHFAVTEFRTTPPGYLVEGWPPLGAWTIYAAAAAGCLLVAAGVVWPARHVESLATLGKEPARQDIMSPGEQ